MRHDGAAASRSTVLVAANDHFYPRFPCYMLRNAGFQVIEAQHGYEALYLASQHASDLRVVIAEMNLRFVGGWELAMRLTDLRPELKVLLLTSDELTEALWTDNRCLPMDSSPERILQTVRELLKPEASRRPIPNRDHSFYAAAPALAFRSFN